MAWELLTLIYLSFSIFRFASSALNNDFELIMVQTVWRHGDRNVEAFLKNDPVDPKAWKMGGGGPGQLTTYGMGQHYLLGKLIRKRYITSDFPGFLSEHYDSSQIYVRSTDVNRTITSAMSNMLGMYPIGRPKIDFPDDPDIDWPAGFIPIPIHSGSQFETDCLLNTVCHCDKRSAVIAHAHEGKEFQDFISSPNYINTSQFLSELFETKITYDNMYKVTDMLDTERIQFMDRLQSAKWYSEEFYKNVKDVERKTKGLYIGLYDPPVVNGINVRKEIQKLRGGPLVNEISGRMRTKYNCYKSPSKCDEFHTNIKYYAYSTHDHTLMSWLTIFELEDIVTGRELRGEWPDFAACVAIELFVHKTTKEPFFRVLYHRDVTADFEIVTNRIKGCKSQEFCELKVFENRAKDYRPDGPINQMCEIKKGETLYLKTARKGIFWIGLAFSMIVFKAGQWI